MRTLGLDRKIRSNSRWAYACAIDRDGIPWRALGCGRCSCSAADRNSRYDQPRYLSSGSLVRYTERYVRSRASVSRWCRDAIHRTLDRKLVRELAGTVTLSCDGRTLKHSLPTGWGRALLGRVTTVIVRFRADTQKRYVCLLRLKHVPAGLPHDAFVVVRCVTPHFHPGHHVYELQ